MVALFTVLGDVVVAASDDGRSSRRRAVATDALVAPPGPSRHWLNEENICLNFLMPFLISLHHPFHPAVLQGSVWI